MTLFVLLRLRAHRVLMGASLVVVLLATTLLATLALFAQSVGDAALRHALGDQGGAGATLVVSAEVPAGQEKGADRAVRRDAATAFDGLPVTVRAFTQSGTYALPAGLGGRVAPGGKPDLTQFAALDASRVRVVAGSLPHGAAASGPLPVALPQRVARQWDLGPGAEFEVTDRAGGKRLAVRVTGVYRPADTTDPYWQADPLRGRGARTVSFTTYGPLAVSAEAAASGRLAAGTSSWVAVADTRGVRTGDTGALRRASVAGAERLRTEAALGGNAQVRDGVPALLDRFATTLGVYRSTLLIVAVQLVLLAWCALVLVAQLLSAERAGHTELLRHRGASRARVVGLAGAEALAVAVPALVVAPLLAGPLARLLVERSSLADGGLRLAYGATPLVWLVSVGFAVVCGLVLTGALAAGSGAGRGRVGALPGFLRAGADLGLLVAAGLAFWQLAGQGPRESGGAGPDWLLVVAPALALLAGTVLVLRLVPLAARLAERLAARGRGLPGALVAWQFSRRPQRGAGPVLLLVLAVAMTLLTVAQSASWSRAQDDQADFRSGAGVRVLDPTSGLAGDAGTYGAVPGVRAVAPGHRASVDLPQGGGATVLALDTAHAPDDLLFRSDIAPGEGELRALRAAGDGARAGLALPAGTRKLALRVRWEDSRTGKAPEEFAPALTVTVRDAQGQPYVLSAGRLAGPGAVRTQTVDLVPEGRDVPRGRLWLSGLRVSGELPPGLDARVRLGVERVGALTGTGGGAGRAVAVPEGLRWQGTSTPVVELTPGRAVPLRPEAAAGRPLSVTAHLSAPRESWASSGTGVNLDVWAGATEVPATVPALASDAFLKAAHAKRGQTLTVPVEGTEVRVEVVDTVAHVPTTGEDAATAADASGQDSGSPSGEEATEEDGAGGDDADVALLVDLPTLNAVLAGAGATPLAPTEWWLSTAEGRSGAVAARLRERPDSDPADVLVRDEVRRTLVGDPLGAAPRTALLAAALAAAAIAAVGFTAGAMGSLRERRSEHAVLRALGISGRKLARQTFWEQVLLVAVGLGAGLALGVVLSRWLVPLTVLTARAARPVPGVLVEMPWGRALLLLVGVAALPLLAVALLSTRRTRIADALRRLED
ncbi:FtsX-like permease family protein [Streptomyces sp. NPDC006684]|uniref:FtsX-like permease family protein n=1 Tax=Streptomyces sp. NPDC006684 TaxID=3154477 RepID=UPI003452CE7A